MKNDKQKSCESCKFFTAYYVKRGVSFRRVPCKGCCKNKSVTAVKAKQAIKQGSECVFWERYENGNKNVRDAVKQIQVRLEEIAQLINRL